MKKLVNVYHYETTYNDVSNDNEIKYEKKNGVLYAEHAKRNYKTKMTVNDLPEYYCNIHRYNCNYDCISAKNIVDLRYKWVKENHFMKDSILRISYTGKIEPYYENDLLCFPSYTNEDAIVYGIEIFKFLAYANKYSGYNLRDIKNQIMQQCEWLRQNEPAFAPDTDDYGKWFDDTIKEYQNNN